MQTTLNPYILFDGDCREAMTFYQSCLGGKLSMSTYGESGAPHPADQKDDIIHAALDNDRLTIMASDWNHEMSGYTLGNNVHLSVAGSDEAALTEMFTKLSAGGTVKMPLQKQFWGDTFGMLSDKFGIQWMINISAKK
jgi:PhnB protein